MLSACVWWRLYMTKQQLDQFDRYFSVQISAAFTLYFKEPLILSEDFDYLAKLLPTHCVLEAGEKSCVYRFYKVDKAMQEIKPRVEFFFTLAYNQNDQLNSWTLSPIFLRIAPPEFLEASLRSLGGAEINRSKHQLKANAETIKRISAALPHKKDVRKYLGKPLAIEVDQELEILIYHFLLDTPKITAGYEQRALSVIRLAFNSGSELVKMKGSFAGLKIGIDYRKYKL